MKPNRSTATAEAMYSLDSDCTNWSVIGETVQWHGSADTKPTDAEIKAEVDRLDAEYDSLEYGRTRASEYLPIGDQLDMQYKDLINGTTTWKDHVAKVKLDNPKG
jgi:hypothetical protein